MKGFWCSWMVFVIMCPVAVAKRHLSNTMAHIGPRVCVCNMSKQQPFKYQLCVTWGRTAPSKAS